MKILVYEDDTCDYENLKKNIYIFFTTRDVEYELLRINESAELFHNLYDSDLIFLDIELQNENGIDIGVNIRKLSKGIIIIFFTNFSQYLIDGYKARAERYFLKPIQQQQFNAEMDSILEEYLLNNSGFIDLNLSPNKIYFKDIVYIEFVNITRKTVLHMINGNNIETHYPLKYWLNRLSKHPFSQSYQSLLVNLNCVSGFKKNSLILINNEIIPLSRGYYKAFKEANIINLHKRM